MAESRGRRTLRRSCALAALIAAAATLVVLVVRRDFGQPSNVAKTGVAGSAVGAEGFPTTFCDHQKASRRGTAAYVVSLSNGVSKIEAIKSVRTCGGRVIGPMPPNALLVETSIFALGKMSVDGHFASAREWLPEDKVDSRFDSILKAGPEEIDATVIALAADDLEGIVERVVAAGGKKLDGCLNGRSSVTLHLPSKLLDELVKRGDVRWIEPFERPKFLNDIAVGPTAMNVRSVWNRHGLTGANQVITTSDSGIDTGDLSTMHADLRNRLVGFKTAGSNCYAYDASGHGTHTAGSIVGDGTMSDGQIRGAAYGAKLWAWFCGGTDDYVYTPENCAELFRPEGATNACVHSASWGSSVNGAYVSYCHDVDEYVWKHVDFLMVVANGNEGSSARTVDSPASAKNVLAVGATQSARTDGDGGWGNGDVTRTATFSSRGPCTDGRIKPDVSAPGVGIASTRAYACSYAYGVLANTNYAYDCGTSMATPLTAGAAALVRQWLTERRGFTNAPPTAALVKAVLTGGATGCLAPDNNQGWGRVDLGESLYPSNRAVRLVDRIPFAENYEYVSEVTLTNDSPFEVQLVWIDYPATAGSSATLVNDLDLVVSNRTTGALWYGNGIAGGDRTNTLESVRIAVAEKGEYSVYVQGRNIFHPSAEGGAAALYLRGAFAADEESEEPASLEIASAEPSVSELSLQVGETNRFAVTVSASAGLEVAYDWTIDGTSVTGATASRLDWSPVWTNRGSRVVKVTASGDGAVPVSRSWIVSVWDEIAVEAEHGDDATATGEKDSPFATISAALARAVANDVVRVGPGLYVGGIVAPSALVRIESREGPDSTIIDGGDTNRCFDAYYNMNTVLSGFTLTNGWLEAEDHYDYGAGAYGGVLTNCVIVDCDIEDYGYGGGAYNATLIDCRVLDCFAGLAGGGLYNCTASFCLLTDNAADWFTSSYGGGAAQSVLTHCTVYGNLAAASGGGVDADCTCVDSIVWNNEIESGADSNWEQYVDRGRAYVSSFSHCCTTPTGYKDLGGNTNAAPRWVDAAEGDFRLGTGSPCLAAASDGGNMGAWQGGGVPGHVLTAVTDGPGEIAPESVFVTDGGTATFTASVHHPFCGWTTNGVAAVGTTNVFVWTDVRADGVVGAAFASTNFFVDAEFGNDESNGWSRAAAKRTIQGAVKVAAEGETVLVNPGVYTGTVVTTAARIDIVATGGPDVTRIVGKGGTNRCFSAWLSPSTRLVGFTLENGLSEENYGGAVFYGTLSNCVIRNSFAALGGGGAFGATLVGCTIADCIAGTQGGGAYASTLVNCSVRGNQARTLRRYYGGYAVASTFAGGGVDCQSLCTNTVVWGNLGPSGCEDNGESLVDSYRDRWGNWYRDVYEPSLYWCCTFPAGVYGANSFTNDPQFVSATNADNRVYETSLCIGSGFGGANVGAYSGAGVARVLPVLSENPTGAEVARAVESVGYADANVVTGIGTNLTTYSRFAAWTTNGLTSKAVVLSTRAFDSFLISDILATPMLLSDGVTSEISLSALTPAADGKCEVTVSLLDGETLIPLAAAKDAFAAHARLGTEPSRLEPAEASRIEASPAADGKSVTLTITPPDPTPRYFMRFDVRTD